MLGLNVIEKRDGSFLLLLRVVGKLSPLAEKRAEIYVHAQARTTSLFLRIETAGYQQCQITHDPRLNNTTRESHTDFILLYI